MEANGSGQIVFEMDERRGCLSVRIPVHPSFARKDASLERARAYEQRVLEALDPQGMSLTDLARAMGYKGITKKLSKTVDALCKRGAIARRPADSGASTVLLPEQ
ncbi:MAG TPA: hypothetical protein DCP91_05415 [Eggerthellaceae bacterium]|nr:hypothetical protein [Eggerthellaceae bacterium]